jgi:hypothetical protein
LTETNNKLEAEKQTFQQNIVANKKSIITIVSLIVTIVPLLTINIGALANSFNVLLMLFINGILLEVIGGVFHINK